MMSLFAVDKSDLVRQVLDRLAVRYRPGHRGWQPVRCPNEDGHRHGDRNASASVSLRYGYLHCHACGLRGDGFDLMLELEDMKAPAVLTSLGMAPGRAEPEWLI